MKALYTTSPGEYGLADRPRPAPAAGEALLKVVSAGFCANDILIRQGSLTSVGFPLIPGHQYAGIVEECGPDVRYVEPGDRVAVHAYVLCGQCPPCRKGGVHDCERFLNLGFTLDGGLAEYNVAPAKCLFRLPDHVTLEEGSLLENLSNGVAAVRRAALDVGDTVVIVGATPIGLLALQVARLASPAALVLAGSGESRLALARQLGASDTVDLASDGPSERLRAVLGGRGADAAIVCGYTRGELEIAMGIVGSQGRVVVEGHFDPAVEMTISPRDLLVARAVTLLGNRGWTTPDYARALELVAIGMVDVKRVVTHTFALADWETAFEAFGSPEAGAVHVAIAP